MKSALRSFVFSLLSLLPVAGLGFIVAAVLEGRRAERLAGNDWNPAGRYLKAAHWFILAGLLSTVVFVALACLVIPSMVQDMGSSCSGSS